MKTGTTSLLREDIEHTVRIMAAALFKETGLKLRVNEGFRDYARQKKLFEEYKKKLQKWKDDGSPKR